MRRLTVLLGGLTAIAAAEFRQFDFWIGDWNVEAPANPGRISRNRITRTNGGCALYLEGGLQG